MKALVTAEESAKGAQGHGALPTHTGLNAKKGKRHDCIDICP
jgi:hypothetical protein